MRLYTIFNRFRQPVLSVARNNQKEALQYFIEHWGLFDRAEFIEKPDFLRVKAWGVENRITLRVKGGKFSGTYQAGIKKMLNKCK